VIAGVVEHAPAASVSSVKKIATEDVRIVGRNDTRSAPVITDRMTAKVLGLLLLVFPMLIDVSCFIFTPAENRQRPGFAALVIVPSLPFFGIGIYLLKRADRLKEDDD
jgi:hypothetical protein